MLDLLFSKTYNLNLLLYKKGEGLDKNLRSIDDVPFLNLSCRIRWAS